LHRRIAIAVVVLAASSAAAGRSRNVVQKLSERGSVDWTRGVILAVGAAAADLQAPTPTVARIRAERVARERAGAKLAAQARALPVAAGKTVGEHLDGDAAARARFERAIARALDEAIDYSSDGSVVVTLALPVEAVRIAVSGPAAPPTGTGPTAVVVDARKVMTEPSVGVRVGDYAGPVVFYRSVKAAARDRRAGGDVARSTAIGLSDGALAIEGDADWAGAAPLLLVVIGK
jgi:hypothetical protein